MKHKIKEGTIIEINEAKDGLLLKPYNLLAEMKGLGKEVFGDSIGYQRKMRDEWERSE